MDDDESSKEFENVKWIRETLLFIRKVENGTAQRKPGGSDKREAAEDKAP